MNKPVLVGLSQRLQLDWLERTAQLQLSSAPQSEIRGELDLLLGKHLSVGTTSKAQTNRRKAINNLMRIWVSVPSDLEPLRDEGLRHLQTLTCDQHLPIHWGMTMVAYPFFQLMAETVGRLINVQGSVAASQVYRRIYEQLGERSTVSRAARRVLRTFIDWRVIKDTPEKGVYCPVSPYPIADSHVSLWLIETSLRASGASSCPLNSIVQTPALFPFNVKLAILGKLSSNSRLEVSRQGLDSNIVTLK